jgi:small subunit ribosomal protein S20
MPVIKSAIKQMKNNAKRRQRNLPLKTKIKTVFKTNLDLVKEGKLEEAKTQLSRSYKVIDTAVKKNLLNKNTASRRKSRLAREIRLLEEKSAK